MAFSNDWALRSGCAKSTPVQEKLPDFSLSLWQAEQVRLTKACWEATLENASGLWALAALPNKTEATIRMKLLRLILPVDYIDLGL